MFTVKLFDRDHQELKIGDIVAISDGKALKFYAEIQFMEKERMVSPFHTFSFHSVKKVEKVPDGAELCTEDRFKCWYMPNPENDAVSERHNDYLIEWRKCERMLEHTMFEVSPATI